MITKKITSDAKNKLILKPRIFVATMLYFVGIIGYNSESVHLYILEVIGQFY